MTSILELHLNLRYICFAEPAVAFSVIPAPIVCFYWKGLELYSSKLHRFGIHHRDFRGQSKVWRFGGHPPIQVSFHF